MKEKTVLVTGSTDGIGKQTAIDLAEQGFRVIVHGRNKVRGDECISALRSLLPGGKFELLICDLGMLSDVKKAADEINSRFPKLDILINNAGVVMKRRELSVDGYELTFQINYLSHFLLTMLLLDNLKNADQGRIINVSSNVHHSGKFEIDNLQGERYYDSYNAYACSKLHQVISTVYLAKKLKDSRLTINALHPGVISTKLLRSGWGSSGAPVKHGAATSVFLATDDSVSNVSGKYFVDCREGRMSAIAQDEKVQQELWEVSEKMSHSQLQ